MKSKYYVVWVGKKTGIFTSWDECKRLVLGVSGAKFKSFFSKKEAEKAYQIGWATYYWSEETHNMSQNITIDNTKNTSYIEESICVDAAYSGNPGHGIQRCIHKNR